MTQLTGTGRLLWLALRRERTIAPVWIGLLTLIIVGTAANYLRLFPDPAVRQSFAAEVSHNAVLTAFAGQLIGTGYGALTVWRVGDTAYTLIALMALLTMLRNTRAEEEAGRSELLGALAVGRYAALSAALIVTSSACAITGALVALGLIGLGLEAGGAIAFALAIAGTGWVFAAIGALAAQLSESTRTDTIIGIAALSYSYMLRFVADGSGFYWLKWLTPNGWAHLVQPFAVPRWLALAPMIAAALIILAAAYSLAARRDLMAGLLPPRQGPANAPQLRSPLALAWRLQRGALVGWLAGFAVISIALAGMAGTLPEIVRQSTWAQEFLSRYSGSPQASISDIFLEIIIVSFGMTAAFYPALTVLRLRSEEAAGYAELLLSTAAGRMRWALSHLFLALLGTTLILATGGVVLGLGRGMQNGDIQAQVARVLLACLLHVPAAWILGGAALLFFGALPRFAAALTWAALLYVQLIGEVLGPIFFGQSYRYQVVNGLQPFHWVPKISSGAALSIAPIAALLSLGMLLIAGGLFLFQRRDVM